MRRDVLQKESQEFPGGLVVGTWGSHYQPGFRNSAVTEKGRGHYVSLPIPAQPFCSLYKEQQLESNASIHSSSFSANLITPSTVGDPW